MSSRLLTPESTWGGASWGCHFKPMHLNHQQGQGEGWCPLGRAEPRSPHREWLRRSHPPPCGDTREQAKLRWSLVKSLGSVPAHSWMNEQGYTMENGHKNLSLEFLSCCAWERSARDCIANLSKRQTTLWTHWGAGPCYCSQVKRMGHRATQPISGRTHSRQQELKSTLLTTHNVCLETPTTFGNVVSVIIALEVSFRQ